MDIDEKEIQEDIDFEPHQKQKEIDYAFKEGKREIAICAGRRSGKSAYCGYTALRKGLQEGQTIWVVSPTYDLSEKVFNYTTRWLLEMFPEGGGWVSRRTPADITLPWGTKIECKSTDSPSGLLGEEVDLLIVDEAAKINKDVWENYLYPVTVSRGAQSIFISTPWGKNWFYEKFLECKDNGAAFQFESRDNPYFHPGHRECLKNDEVCPEWERAKQRLPETSFRQSFMATFEEGAGSVFRNVKEIISTRLPKKPRPERSYLMGVDLGKHNDFTVITVLDLINHEVVYFDRFNETSWTLQKSRIEATARKYNNARIIIDRQNIGSALSDQLQSEGLLVDEITSTGRGSTSKQNLIEKLSSYIEQRSIKIPNEEVLIDELEAYTYDMTQQGNIRYSAPTGYHDDSVDSLALAVWGLSTPNVGMKKANIENNRNKKVKPFQYD